MKKQFIEVESKGSVSVYVNIDKIKQLVSNKNEYALEFDNGKRLPMSKDLFESLTK